MTDLIQTIDAPEQISALGRGLRQSSCGQGMAIGAVLEVFERWSALLRGVSGEEVPGVPFLSLWLRRGALEPILQRELGAEFLTGGWGQERRGRLGVFPLGVVGHWPAGNIEIQPVLSMTCALLGGNACLVRVPSGLREATGRLLEKLRQADERGTVTERVAWVGFDHSRLDLQEAMARTVDGAMIWGGAEAVTRVRGLPFPHWARIAVFGPRLSAAAMDAQTWNSPAERASWCQRIARDVWQFDQQACSSPQVLFLEKGAGPGVDGFVEALRRAFEEENRLHPRTRIHPALASAICLARASWLLEDVGRKAFFPRSPDWTILVGQGSAIPKPTQGRTLYVLGVDDLMEPISKFGGAVQTLGLAVNHIQREAALASAAGGAGVDRIVRLGQMHVFGSPWDGTDLIRPMVRLVRHQPSRQET